MNSGTVAVNSGTFTINNTTGSPATGTGPMTITVASAATLQLAGTSSALTAGVNIVNNGSAASGGGLLVTGTNQTVGSITGTTGMGAATIYSGDTVVASGATLTATQILQNSLTIGSGATVTISPSTGTEMTALPSSSVATAGGTADAATSNVASTGASDPFSAIQAAIAGGSISSTTGEVLENRIAAIERLAATDPGLDVSLLESRVLAVIPSADFAATGSSVDPGANLLAIDSRTFASPSGAVASFSSTGSFSGGAAAVPEPSSLLLAGLGAIGLAAMFVRRRQFAGRLAPASEVRAKR